MDKKYILAIESSCDDTSVAILDGNTVLSCVTENRNKSLLKYGGVVPELASRNHADLINNVFEAAIKEARISKKNIKYICYTSEPGLVGSLHVGEIFAKSLGFALDVDVFPINHIHGHIFSPFINENPVYPFLSLIVSGKTSSIFLVKSPTEIKELVKTVDDAAGEAFDKIGKILGYPYPGGPQIDKNFDEKKTIIKFPYPQINKDFSFSGIKNRIFSMINTSKMKNEPIDVVAIGSSFMKWLVEVLIKKLVFFAKEYSVKFVCIGGGVSANSLFKNEIKKHFSVCKIPAKEYSCDNAAMIGYYFWLKNFNCFTIK
ncbi:MAG: tRNA (adenosine(37)-N6)-threonylcarbamoyltransferase complex transferase subunit TsaD [Mycoplasma sp.]|nr:tRNA (adenosine(37)-N6)-threonylcarbamoyltransferase complex transferase subunit TsaD [Mycoplasma sp.]